MSDSKRQQDEKARNDSKRDGQGRKKTRDDSKRQAGSDSTRQQNDKTRQDEDPEEQAKNPAGERRITYIAIVILLVGVASIAGVSTLDYFKGEGFWGKPAAADSKKPAESKK